MVFLLNVTLMEGSINIFPSSIIQLLLCYTLEPEVGDSNDILESQLHQPPMPLYQANTPGEFDDTTTISPHIEPAREMEIPVSTNVHNMSVSLSPTPEHSESSTDWTDKISAPTLHPFVTHPPTGTNVPVPETPRNVFELFFTQDLMEEIAHQINKYFLLQTNSIAG